MLQVAEELYAQEEAPADTCSAANDGIRVIFSMRRPVLPDAFAAMGPGGDSAQQATERLTPLVPATGPATAADSQPGVPPAAAAASAEAASPFAAPADEGVSIEGSDMDDVILVGEVAAAAPALEAGSAWEAPLDLTQYELPATAAVQGAASVAEAAADGDVAPALEGKASGGASQRGQGLTGLGLCEIQNHRACLG